MPIGVDFGGCNVLEDVTSAMLEEATIAVPIVIELPFCELPSRRGSGEVYVVAEAVLGGALEQDRLMGAFRLARSAANQNDQSGLFWRSPGERQEVITVAADENPSLRASISKDFFIGCGSRQDRMQARSVVSPVLQERIIWQWRDDKERLPGNEATIGTTIAATAEK